MNAEQQAKLRKSTRKPFEMRGRKESTSSNALKPVAKQQEDQKTEVDDIMSEISMPEIDYSERK